MLPSLNAKSWDADELVYSEDLQDGQTIRGLTIRNPFQKG